MVVRDHELGTVGRVVHPAAFHAQSLAHAHGGEVAGDGDQLLLARHLEAGDGVAVLLVGVGDALEDAVNHLNAFRRGVCVTYFVVHGGRLCGKMMACCR